MSWELQEQRPSEAHGIGAELDHQAGVGKMPRTRLSPSDAKKGAAKKSAILCHVVIAHYWASPFIVGGGCIGLSTAYNLAKRTVGKIKVIEAFDKTFAAASSSCTGCFHYGFPEPQTQPLIPLGKYSFDMWAAEAQEDDFVSATGYRAQSSFGADPGTGQRLNRLPG
ncbi:hypothetical protein B0I35DRAFT_481900 [Stachybotrys elegans]|uniref:FAD dependent oxidoreductase domain-containing protein n=1 Tax=Stachybotrys elegans TaxID=80388 RepID=A0A8K0WN05_9HYPO|nr:hypothetical protein B0I35DRAFT_481900 [Stachybotrys elegans]